MTLYPVHGRVRLVAGLDLVGYAERVIVQGTVGGILAFLLVNALR